jgi:hypothetical protein
MKNYLLIVYQSYSPRKHVVYEMSHWLRLGLTAHKHQIKAPHFLFSSKKWHPDRDPGSFFSHFAVWTVGKDMKQVKWIVIPGSVL